VEGLFRGFSSRFLLVGLIEAVGIDFFLISDVSLYDREELIISLPAIAANSLLHVYAFVQTSGDEVLFQVFISTSYMDNFFMEPLDVISEMFASSLDNGFEGPTVLGWVLKTVK
jgi:hypothetical protein